MMGRICGLLGMLLMLLSLLPWYGLLTIRGSGPQAQQALRLGSVYWQSGWAGLLLMALVAVILSGLVRGSWPSRIAERSALVLSSVSLGRLGFVCGLLATGFAGWVTSSVLQGQAPLLDSIAQLIHGRYVAAGELSGPALEDPAFWQFQFMVDASAGWVSQYPPGHVALLGLARKLGFVQLVGPLLLGASVWMTSIVADHLIPEDVLVARLAVVLMAFSPFLAFHAASYMSHTLALSLTLLAVLAALRSPGGPWWWPMVLGAALGALVLTRPYTGLYYGVPVVFLMLALTHRIRPMAVREGLARLALVSAGALPFLASLATYNWVVFGKPLTFGYVVAEGPGHGLGFHVDPWGSVYGPLEALAYTSADLQGLGLDLLPLPFPVVVLIGVTLLVCGGLSLGMLVALGLALTPVLAHVFYWHHDLFMGPRLLYEAVPWWCMLVAFSAVRALRALPTYSRVSRRLIVFPRNGLGAALVGSFLIGVLYAGPQRLASYAGVVTVPPGGDIAKWGEAQSLVFVHTDWEDRLAARLSADGMRLDSVRAALRQNSSCHIELHLASLENGPALPLKADPAVGSDPRLHDVRMPSGAVVRTFEGEALPAVCERQAASDFAGVLALPPFVWLGDLPGLERGAPMFVRDLGPERNAQLVARFADREPKVLLREGRQVRLVDYSPAMSALWAMPAQEIGPPE